MAKVSKADKSAKSKNGSKEKKMKTPSTVTVRMRLRKETKGAVAYEEVNADEEVLKTSDPDCVIGSIYLRKSAVGKKTPDFITVVVSLTD